MKKVYKNVISSEWEKEPTIEEQKTLFKFLKGMFMHDIEWAKIDGLKITNAEIEECKIDVVPCLYKEGITNIKLLTISKTSNNK